MPSRLPLLFALFLILLAAPGLAAGPQEARLTPAFGDAELREAVQQGLEAALAGEDEAAVEQLTRALDAWDLRDLPQPVRARLHGARAGALLRLGRADKALLDFHRVIRLDAADPEGWYGRATVRAEQGERDQALADLAEAIRLKPDFDRALRLQAQLLDDRGNLNQDALGPLRSEP